MALTIVPHPRTNCYSFNSATTPTVPPPPPSPQDGENTGGRAGRWGESLLARIIVVEIDHVAGKESTDRASGMKDGMSLMRIDDAEHEKGKCRKWDFATIATDHHEIHLNSTGRGVGKGSCLKSHGTEWVRE